MVSFSSFSLLGTSLQRPDAPLSSAPHHKDATLLSPLYLSSAPPDKDATLFSPQHFPLIPASLASFRLSTCVAKLGSPHNITHYDGLRLVKGTYGYGVCCLLLLSYCFKIFVFLLLFLLCWVFSWKKTDYTILRSKDIFETLMRSPNTESFLLVRQQYMTVDKIFFFLCIYN